MLFDRPQVIHHCYQANVSIYQVQRKEFWSCPADSPDILFKVSYININVQKCFSTRHSNLDEQEPRTEEPDFWNGGHLFDCQQISFLASSWWWDEQIAQVIVLYLNNIEQRRELGYRSAAFQPITVTTRPISFEDLFWGFSTTHWVFSLCGWIFPWYTDNKHSFNCGSPL